MNYVQIAEDATGRLWSFVVNNYFIVQFVPNLQTREIWTLHASIRRRAITSILHSSTKWQYVRDGSQEGDAEYTCTHTRTHAHTHTHKHDTHTWTHTHTNTHAHTCWHLHVVHTCRHTHNYMHVKWANTQIPITYPLCCYEHNGVEPVTTISLLYTKSLQLL